MQRKRRKTAVPLPKGVQAVVSRGRTYYYFQAHRGTPQQGERIRLPDDPQSPEFWTAVRQAQGLEGEVAGRTVGAAIDAFLSPVTNPHFSTLAKGTQSFYRINLAEASDAWGELPAAGLRPKHVIALMDKFAGQPGKANNFLGSMRAFSKWAFVKDYLSCSVTEGIKTVPVLTGHKPWTEKQIKAAHEHLTGMVRRGIMLMLYTGQRGSDVVRLGPTFVDDGGFSLGQTKTGVEVWCPIVPELEAEMIEWERRPGPFLLQPHGATYTRKRLWLHYKAQADKIPELKGTTLHGLRSTAVVRLRREGMTTAQIQDIVGLSLDMIERYCRFADKKISGQAVLHELRTRAELKLKNTGKLASKNTA